MFISVQRIFRSQSANAGQSHFVGQTKTIEKERVERFATLTREEREKKPVRLELKLTPSQASL